MDTKVNAPRDDAVSAPDVDTDVAAALLNSAALDDDEFYGVRCHSRGQERHRRDVAV